MNLRIKITLYIFIIVVLSSCIKYQDLIISPVRSYNFNGFDNNKLDFVLKVPIKNPNRQNIIISDIKLKAYYKNIPVGRILSKDKIIIEKNSSKEYNISVTVQITNVLAGFALMASPSKSIELLKFEGSIHIKKGLFQRDIIIDKTMSEQYLKF